MFEGKDLESKIQDNLRLDQECYPETEVESLYVKSPSKRPASIFSAAGRLRDCILVSDQLYLGTDH